jgi:hypothetical protein
LLAGGADNWISEPVALWSKKPAAAPSTDVFQAYRQTDPRYPPLWYGAGRATLLQQSGRWHEEGKGVAQYLSLSVDGAWAEWIRYESIRDDVRRLEDRRTLWQIQVAEQRIADLSTFDKYVECGLKPEWAIGPHQDCWPLADELRNGGFDGVLSPAAALDVPDAVNLTLFGERIEHRVHGPMPKPSAFPRPELFLPTIEITEQGAATRYALEHTCYIGEHHQTFAAWCKSSGYTP